MMYGDFLKEKFAHTGVKYGEVEGEPPLTLTKSKGKTLKDYRVYGNSTQDGTPTPNDPIEIENVGDKTNNICPYCCTMYPSYKAFSPHKFPIKAGVTYSIFFSKKVGTWYKSIYLYDSNGDYRKTVAHYAYAPLTYSAWVVKPQEDGYMAIGMYVDEDPYSIATVIEGLQYSLSITENTNLNNNEWVRPTSFTGDLKIEPYGKYKIPVHIAGKNLYDGNDYYLVTGEGALNDTPKEWLDIFEPTKTYTIFIYVDNTNATANSSARMAVGKSGGWDYNNFSKINSGTKGWIYCTFIVPSNYNKQLNMQYNPGSNTKGVEYSKIMCVEGSYNLTNMPEYIKGLNEIIDIYLDEPLRKIGNYSDYIDYKNKKVVKNISKKLLRVKDVPSNLLAGYSIGRDTSFFAETGELPFKPLCKYLEGINDANYAVANTITHYRTATGQRQQMMVCLPQSLLNTTDSSSGSEIVTAINNWAINNNVMVYYPITTPIKEDIELPDIPTSKGDCIIDVATLLKPSSMYVKYEK